CKPGKICRIEVATTTSLHLYINGVCKRYLLRFALSNKGCCTVTQCLVRLFNLFLWQFRIDVEAELVDAGFVITRGELLLGAAGTVFDVCCHNPVTVPRKKGGSNRATCCPTPYLGQLKKGAGIL